MGKVIVFPGTHECSTQTIEVESESTLVQKAEHFLQLRYRQQILEQSSAMHDVLPAQRKMSRLAIEMLDVRIDRAVQNLVQAPADAQEARTNIRTLFSFADSRPEATDVLEEAALYVTSAYWNANYVTTTEVAPLLHGRAIAAELRHDVADGPPATVDAIHAVVTEYVVGCFTGERLQRMHQIEQHGLLPYFDHPNEDPDFPPAA